MPPRSDDPWAVTEFAEAELGDTRRTQRLIALATVLAQRPGASLPEACGDHAMLKAAYRFFDNVALEPQDLLDSHLGATFPRLAAVPLVLAVQDTTELDWTAHPATTGLGSLGHSAHRGLFVHTTLAFTPERVPLGILAQHVWARDPDDIGKRATRKQRPMAEKESQKWLTSVEAVLAARRACPQTRFVSVGDREADVYDVLAGERPAGVDLLMRAAWDRCVTHAEHDVWATVAAQPVAAATTLQVPRRGPQPPRTASLAVRWGPLTLCPPRHRRRERLQRCVPLYSVIAWRIFYATMLSRAVPEAPCTVLLELEEWQALSCAIHRMPTPPSEPPSLRQAVHWIARLGGFLGRRGDGKPGTTVLWKGFQQLTALTTMYCIMRPAPPKRRKYG